ncbi:MAG: hypothetical protein ACHQT5_00040 [Candidatus Saccharimonadales bacterium]|jgi:hypothetical protein
MSLTELFGILSGTVILFGGPPYLFDILKGKTKPQRTTWFIWTFLGSIAFTSQLKLGAHWSLVYVGLNVVGNLAVFLLSLKFGTGGWRKLDVLALFIACMGVTMSFLFTNPLMALSGSIVADFAGSSLTLYKVYLDPSSETSITWFFIGTSSLFAALAVGKWDFSLLLYPAYICVATYGVLVAQWLGRFVRPHPSPSRIAHSTTH